MRRWDDWLTAQAESRRTAGTERALHPRPAIEDVVDLAGNDYLGLSRHPAVIAAAAQATITWGAGAGASRLVTGALQLHAELERELAAYLHRPAALLFSTGYQANLAVVAALAGRDGFVVSDAHVHASLVDGVRLARADYAVVAHNDSHAVERALSGAGDRRAMVLVESVYSVLGDRAPLRQLASICAEHGALLVVDEAHALGVCRAGGVHDEGLGAEPFVVSTATLSKAMGSQGGVVLAEQAILDQLVNTARPFIFDTGLAPAATAAALAAVRMLAADPMMTRVVELRSEALARALGLPLPGGAVLSMPMPSPQAALAAQADALAEGVRIGCFRPPSTPDHVSRLRITVSAGVSEVDWARAVDVVLAVVKEHA